MSPASGACLAEAFEPGVEPATTLPDVVAPASESASGSSGKRAFLKRASGRGAAGVQRRSTTIADGEVGLLPFLRGTGYDYQGRTLEEILGWDYARMEKRHDYIQWLFPTNEKSKFNRRAPLLTQHLQASIRGDPTATDAIRKALVKFCDFLGLELLQPQVEEHGAMGPLIIRPASHFEERVPDCWRGGGPLGRGSNHNWLRISRVLHCLRLVSLDDEAAALLACLEQLPVRGIPCRPSLEYWRQRAALEPPAVGKPAAPAAIVAAETTPNGSGG